MHRVSHCLPWVTVVVRGSESPVSTEPTSQGSLGPAVLRRQVDLCLHKSEEWAPHRGAGICVMPSPMGTLVPLQFTCPSIVELSTWCECLSPASPSILSGWFYPNSLSFLRTWCMQILNKCFLN